MGLELSFGIEIFSALLRLNLRRIANPKPSRGHDGKQQLGHVSLNIVPEAHSRRGLAILSCLPISQPDSHPGSQLVSARSSVLGAGRSASWSASNEVKSMRR